MVDMATEAAQQAPTKRGLKPRSKRNRKRPRSEVLSNDGLEVKSKIVPLTIDDDNNNKDVGDKISGSTSLVRVIEPYVYTFASHAKARWVGRTVLDVYTSEFGAYPKSYYEEAIRNGRILVSDQMVDSSYAVKNTDVLCHRVHRHEPAVAVSTDQPPYVKIIGETDTVVAVDKPATMPVHPCGGYHQNALMPIMEPTHGKLYTIYRLDRLTSGLTILGKTSKVAQTWAKAIKQRENCQKMYLARVKGNFPNNYPSSIPMFPSNTDVPVHGEWNLNEASHGVDNAATMRKRNAFGCWVTDEFGKRTLEKQLLAPNDIDAALRSLESPQESGGIPWLYFSCPVRITEPIRGVSESGTFKDVDDETYMKTVKPAQTAFSVISYDELSDTTLVLCRPETGRTHQIRLHLQQLCHPIANDPNYGGDLFFGNEAGKLTSQKAEERLLVNAREQGVNDMMSSCILVSDSPATIGEVQRFTASKPWDETKETLNAYIERTCIWCARANNPIYEFLVRSQGIWLHALQYTLKNGDECHSFRTELPSWART